ncbi:MAG TPA: TniQ family protein [Rhodocyclaceae bacterium]|jgi:hypothetical protein
MNDMSFSHSLAAPDLLLRPNPSRIEGPQGYLLRLAEANCLSLHELKQQGAKYEPGWLGRNQLLPSEALDPDLHVHVHRMAQLVQDKGRVWNRTQARFCPQCLVEEPIWRASWEVLFHDACPHHGVWLVDQCTSCGQPVSWRREHLLRCACGADLRQETPGSAPESMVRLARQLEAKLLGREVADDSPVLAGLTLEQTQRFVRYLGGYMNPVADNKPLKLRNAAALQASWPITSLAAEILDQWPKAFHDCWSRMQDRVDGDKVNLKGAFRRAHFYLYKGLWESAFSPVRESFELWLSEYWKGGLSKRNHLADKLLANAQWIPAQVGAKQLGISPRRLRTLVRDGFLEGQESLSTTGRRFMVVRRDQLNGVLAQLDNEITLSKAIEMLGIGKIRLRRILKLLFPKARRVSPYGPAPWCVPRADVDELLALGDGLPRVTIPEEDQVTLAHVLRYWAWTMEQVTTLIDTVKRRQMTPISVWEGGRGVTGWVFDKAHLKTWLASLTKGKPTWMTVPQMAKVLGIKQQVAYWLCQNGYLHVDKLGTTTSTREQGSRVRMEEVERFREGYAFGRDIAGSLRTSSRRMARILAEEGIFPIRGHTVIPPRMLIYQLTEELRDFLAVILKIPPSVHRQDSKISGNDSCAEAVGLSCPVGNLSDSFSEPET